MKKVYATFGVGKILLDAGINPLRSVTGNNCNGPTIFLAQQLAELAEYLNSESLLQPDYAVAIHVVNHGDVAVTFLIAGFIDTEPSEAM